MKKGTDAVANSCSGKGTLELTGYNHIRSKKYPVSTENEHRGNCIRMGRPRAGTQFICLKLFMSGWGCIFVCVFSDVSAMDTILQT